MVSQGASNTNVWAKSRALLGSISGVERARVNELVNPEPEKPLAPHWRVPWTLKQYTCSSSSHEQLTIVLGFNILCNPQNRYCFSFGKNPAKVQQRGVAATKSVLLQLLDGMTSGLNFPVLVVDLLPSRLGLNFQCDVLKKMLNPPKKTLGHNMSALHKNPLPEAILPLLHVSRFCEWSSACWEIQKDNLLGTNLDLDLRFLALYHNDDSVHLTSAKECLVGRAMGQWWDRSNEAGPRSRENTRFQEDLPNLEVLCVNLETSTLGILGNEKKTWCWNLVSWALS